MTTSTTTSPLLGRPGAVEGQGADAGVAAHYGDPVREQRLLAEGLAAVDLSHRGVVTVSGPDRLSWLHSMTTQHVLGLAARTSRESLVLSPKGHVEHALHLVDDGETTWLSVEPGTASALVSWLESMRFMLRVEVADVSQGWAVLGSRSVRSRPPARPWPGWTRGRGWWATPSRTGRWRVTRRRVARGASCSCPATGLEAAVGDRPLAGTWAAEALRVAAWRPRLGFETDHRTIPHEVDWLRTAVHLHKGCYRGQETIARVHNLGRPPRRLVFLHLDGSGHVLPDAGSPVLLAEREVGRLTTVAQAPRGRTGGPRRHQAVGGRGRRSCRRRHLGRADRRRQRLSAADPRVCGSLP